MAWSNEEISQFQMDNNKALAEINATLRPDKNLGEDKIGIFAQGQAGDLATCMSVLKYRDEIFPGKQIVWFVNSPNCDLLKYAPICEVRPWPWAGNGLPVGTPDFYPLLCDESNRLNKILAKEYELTADLSDGWFSCAWMLPPPKRDGIEYPNVSRKIFDVSLSKPWHPYLSFADEDYDKADLFFSKIGKGKRICIETFAGSGQSRLDGDMIRKSMQICRDNWGEDCNFIFVSHKYLNGLEEFPSDLVNQPYLYSCADFTVRQCALIVGESDLLISVSSGITVAASCWYNNATPIVQFTGSVICSTQALALGRFELVTADNKMPQDSVNEFYSKLQKLLRNE